MEYNYTRELKQPIKIYTIKGRPIPFFSDGVRLEYLIVSAVILLIVLVAIGVSIALGFNLATYLLKHDWLLLILGVFLAVWILFTLKWDNKKFTDFVMGRFLFRRKKGKTFEHKAEAPFTTGVYQYKRFRQDTYF